MSCHSTFRTHTIGLQVDVGETLALAEEMGVRNYTATSRTSARHPTHTFSPSRSFTCGPLSAYNPRPYSFEWGIANETSTIRCHNACN